MRALIILLLLSTAASSDVRESSLPNLRSKLNAQSTPGNSERHFPAPTGSINKILSKSADFCEWLCKCMQWEYEESDPVFPLSPMFR